MTGTVLEELVVSSEVLTARERLVDYEAAEAAAPAEAEAEAAAPAEAETASPAPEAAAEAPDGGSGA